MRWASILAFLLVSILAVGCGGNNDKKEKGNKDKKSSSGDSKSSKEEVAELSYPNGKAAFEDLVKAKLANDKQKDAQIFAWFKKQGKSASSDLVEVIQDEKADMAERTEALNLMLALNDSADLQELSYTLKPMELRARAMKVLGLVRPVEPKSLEVLTKLLNDSNVEVRTAAAVGIGNMRSAAKDLVPQLRKITNTYELDSKFRTACEYAANKIENEMNEQKGKGAGDDKSEKK